MCVYMMVILENLGVDNCFLVECEIGQVIIDSQPLTVAVLAAFLFGESLGPIAIVGLALGVVGLVLLEVGLSLTCFSLYLMGYPSI